VVGKATGEPSVIFFCPSIPSRPSIAPPQCVIRHLTSPCGRPHNCGVIAATMEESEAPGFRFARLSADHCGSSGGTETRGLRSSGDRTPRDRAGPVWAERKSTHPARGSPCATGRPCQRGSRASGGRVVIATPRRLNRCLLGALGRVLWAVSLKPGQPVPRAVVNKLSPRRHSPKHPPGEGRSVAITLAESMARKEFEPVDNFRRSPVLQCCWERICFGEPGVIAMFLPDDNCTDMRGAVRIAEALDEDVKQVSTFVAGEPDMVYVKRNGEWACYDMRPKGRT